jgi:glycosyltransferase involved in cell wall biosynthesis
LRRLAADLRLEEQVTFAGIVKDAELAALLNRHRIIVTPSRWNEPFGLAPLEGIACGCVALVARCGGLPNAIGPCGVTFERGDAEDLARRLTELLDAKADLTSLRAGAAEHLARHTARAVAAEYLKVFAEETHR